jgi:hypothetical protein
MFWIEIVIVLTIDRIITTRASELTMLHWDQCEFDRRFDFGMPAFVDLHQDVIAASNYKAPGYALLGIVQLVKKRLAALLQLF